MSGLVNVIDGSDTVRATRVADIRSISDVQAYDGKWYCNVYVLEGGELACYTYRSLSKLQVMVYHDVIYNAMLADCTNA